MAKNDLALFGGPKAVSSEHEPMFHWPIVLQEDEDAVLEVLRAGTMSSIDVTKKLEKEIAEWHGMEFALGHNTGTQALQAAMFACEVGKGDEIICPSVTYWASCLQVMNLRGTVVFADILPETLCIDPADIEHRITERTKAIMVVHYCGYPCDMDPILAIAKKHNIKVIEDVSHAQGGHYKGRLNGTMGDVCAFSIMTGKSLAAGEGGILLTNNRRIWERAMAFGHYERYNEENTTEADLKPYMRLPLGGFKNRMHQLTSAMARVQLKYYQERIEEIQQAFNYFWDKLEDTKGVKAHRMPVNSDCDMGGWYAAKGLYVPEELGGLPVTKFVEALQAEGVNGGAGCNLALHLHPLLNDCDVYNEGKPTRIAHSDRDLRQPKGSLPVSEGIQEFVFQLPGFKHFDKKIIDEYVAAYQKVAANYQELL